MRTFKDYVTEADEKVTNELFKITDKHRGNIATILNRYKFGHSGTLDKGRGKWKWAEVFSNDDGIRIAVIFDVHPVYEKKKGVMVKYIEDLSTFPSKNIVNNDVELEKKLGKAPADWDVAIRYVPDIYKKNLMDLEKYLKKNYS